jgi:hypothetical protein
MHNRLAGALLLASAGLTAAIGAAGAQIAYAIVLGGFYAGSHTGVVPPGPQNASIHWLVLASMVILAVSGVYFIFRKDQIHT